MKKRIPAGLAYKCVQVDSLPAKLFFAFKKAKGLQAVLNGRESDFRSISATRASSVQSGISKELGQSQTEPTILHSRSDPNFAARDNLSMDLKG